MKPGVYEKALFVYNDKSDLFDYHEKTGVLERLTPPWINAKVLESPESICSGEKGVLKIKKWFLSRKWVAKHTKYCKHSFFEDIQLKGPFKSWCHRHIFKDTPDGSHLTDRVEYRLPFNRITSPFLDAFVKKELNRMFTYRHSVTQNDIDFFDRNNLSGKRILISGAGGVIGKQLSNILQMQNNDVYHLVRHEASEMREIQYNTAGKYLSKSIENFDIIIHLAGEPIGVGRWSKKKKEQIISSRINTTKFLAEEIKKLNNPPEVFFSASAIGFYGSRGDELLDESRSPGSDFISDVCKMWEDAAMELNNVCRVITGRFGVVLSLKGGALKEYKTFFNMMLGFRIGKGHQYISWICIDDAVYAILHCITDSGVKGPVNITNDTPVRQVDFSKSIAKTMKRPCLITLPPKIITLIFGQKGEELLLSGSKVKPDILLRTNFHWYFKDLDSTIRHLMGRYKNA